MERRLLLVFALTFLVIIVFQPVLKKYLPQPPMQPPASTATQNQNTVPSAPAGNPPNVTQSQPSSHEKTIKATAESDFVVENDLYKITFTNRGGQVKSWILKKYDDEKGRPLDLVNAVAAEKYGYPLSLWAYDEALRNKINSALYVTSSFGQQEAPAEITFDYSDTDVEVHKTFRFDHTYVVRVEASVLAKGSAIGAFPMWPAGFGDQATPASYASSTVDYQFNGSIERLSAKKVSSGNTIKGPFNLAGVADQYFAAVFIPEDPQNAATVTLRNSLDVPKDPQKPNPQDSVKVDVLGSAVGNLVGPTTARLYVGPKSLEVLESVPVPTITGAPQDLRGLVNFGFFGVIARPLFLWLKWTYKYVHNWGWAIVLLTIIIKSAFYPLNHASARSMAKMKVIAPKLKALQEQYANDKQQLQMKMMEMYKTEKINPLGGCLPIVVQIPVFIALYWVLLSAVELRHAPWIGWIHDLSAPDPYFVLPVVYAITAYLQVKLSPTPIQDPVQAKVMQIMPIAFSVMFIFFPSGLVLYWLINNSLQIFQQWHMNRVLEREAAAATARRR